jgi:hypothetical protein
MQVWDVSDHLVNESVNSNCSTHLFTLCERKVTVTSEIHQPSCTFVLFNNISLFVQLGASVRAGRCWMKNVDFWCCVTRGISLSETLMDWIGCTQLVLESIGMSASACSSSCHCCYDPQPKVDR